MNYQHFRKLTTIALASAVLGGCSGVPTAVGTKVDGPLPTGPAREISARACGFQLFLFFPIKVNDRLQRANAALVEQAAGDFITGVQIQESWKYGFVGTTYCTTLTAQAIKAK